MVTVLVASEDDVVSEAWASGIKFRVVVDVAVAVVTIVFVAEVIVAVVTGSFLGGSISIATGVV